MKFTEIVPSKVEDSFPFFIPIVGKSYSHYGNRIIPCVGITDSLRGNKQEGGTFVWRANITNITTNITSSTPLYIVICPSLVML
jgi:hypothetical protein